MDLISLIVILVVIGVLMWAINTFIPIQQQIRQILNAVVTIVVILWLLKLFGILAMLPNIHVGK